jgi:hypothetical protein
MMTVIARWTWLVIAIAAGCTAPPAGSPAVDAAERPAIGAQLHFGGDVYFGESYGAARHEEGFVALEALLRSAPVLANFESTLTTERRSTTALAAHGEIIHGSDPEPTLNTLARHGFVGLSLANNHAMDHGLEALASTREAFAKLDITAFGAGSTAADASEPFVWELTPTRTFVLGAYWERPRYRDVYRIYAGPSAGGARMLALDDVAAQITDLAGDVIVFPHWGRNYRWRSDEQRRLAHSLIDAGADLIVGHGAHSYQEIERYRGRWILYGIGNLIFMAPGRYDESEVPAVSLLVSLCDGGLVLRLLASDNRQTGYQPHPMRGTAFDEALAALQQQSCIDQDDFCREATRGEDPLGPYVHLPR